MSELALHFLDKMKIMVVKDIEREDIEFVCKVSHSNKVVVFEKVLTSLYFLFQTLNCRPIASLDHFLPEYLATADLVESVPTGSSKVVKVLLKLIDDGFGCC